MHWFVILRFSKSLGCTTMAFFDLNGIMHEDWPGLFKHGYGKTMENSIQSYFSQHCRLNYCEEHICFLRFFCFLLSLSWCDWQRFKANRFNNQRVSFFPIWSIIKHFRPNSTSWIALLGRHFHLSLWKKYNSVNISKNALNTPAKVIIMQNRYQNDFFLSLIYLHHRWLSMIYD